MYWHISFILQLVLGLIFLVHGWPKIKDLKSTAENFSGMGFKPGIFWGPLVAVLEFFGGLALIAGFFAQPVAALFVIQFFVIIIWKISKSLPFVGGYELDLLILAALIVLLALGAGEFTMDSLWLWGGF